jgi:hypothetical protein
LRHSPPEERGCSPDPTKPCLHTAVALDNFATLLDQLEHEEHRLKKKEPTKK